MLADKADLPRVVTLSVSTVGGLLVVVNVVLVACVLHRRRQRQGSQGKTAYQVPVHPGGGCVYIGGGGGSVYIILVVVVVLISVVVLVIWGSSFHEGDQSIN